MGSTSVSLLPLAHNLYYGGGPVLTATSALIPQNLVVSPAEIVKDGWDANTGTLIRQQLDGVLQIGVTQRLGDLPPVVRGLQLLWLVAIAAAFLRGDAPRIVPRLMLLVPSLFLGVHVFYQVWVYYPRHIVIGYLAMGAVTFVTMCGHASQRARRSRTRCP